MGWGLIPEWKSQRKSLGSGVSKIWSNINNIWDQLNVELKHHDVTATGTLSSTPTIYNLAEIGLGITGGSSTVIDTGYRDGDKIRVKTINTKVLLRNVSVSQETCWVYLVKYYDNFSTNTAQGAFNWNRVYPINTGSTYATRLRDNNFTKQYKILARRRVPLSGIEDRGNERLINLFHKNTRKAGSYIEWEGGSSTDPSNGKYFLILHNENNTATTFQYSSRIVYIDN